MTSPHRNTSWSVVWLFATLSLASCASHPPVRDVEMSDAEHELRAEYIRTNPHGEFNRNIERSEVVVGMRFDDVLASWGIPDERERNRDRTHERWSYTETDAFSNDWVRYDLLFEKQELASWETMRNVSSSHRLLEVPPARPDIPRSGSIGGLMTRGVVRR